MFRKLLGVRPNGSGEAKVEDSNDSLFRCDEVLRLQIPMNEALGVSRSEATGDLCPKAREGRRFRTPAHQRPPRATLHQLHRQEPATFKFPVLKPADNVRMLPFP